MKRLLTSLALVAAALAGCEAPPEKKTTFQPKRGIYGDALKVAQKLPLERVWDFKFEKPIRNIHLIEKILFIETTDRWLYAFNSANGITLWAFEMEHSLEFPPVLSDTRVFLVASRLLTVLDRTTGDLATKQILHFIPSSPGQASGDKLYIGSHQRFMYVYDSDDKRQYHAWRYQVEGEILAGPVFKSPYLVFATSEDRGKIFVLKEENEQLSEFKVQTAGNVTADITYRDGVFYVGSWDFVLYSLSPNLDWKFVADGEIRVSPVATEHAVYCVAHRKSIHSVDKKTGRQLWKVASGTQFLFEGVYSSFVKVGDSTLVRIHRASRKETGRFQLAPFELFLSNDESNMLYMATRDGQVLAMRERKG